jgi:hypothetical protein
VLLSGTSCRTGVKTPQCPLKSGCLGEHHKSLIFNCIQSQFNQLELLSPTLFDTGFRRSGLRTVLDIDLASVVQGVQPVVNVTNLRSTLMVYWEEVHLDKSEHIEDEMGALWQVPQRMEVLIRKEPKSTSELGVQL